MIGGTILVASDGTGETGEKSVRAALAQFFGNEHVRVEVRPHVLDEAMVRHVIEEAKRRNALLVYTLVSPPLRGMIRALAEEQDLRAIDLLGSLLLQMAIHFNEDPLYTPGLGHELNAEYFRRVDAVEFAVNNDDGREPRNLRKADIILVGISRTSKTPLSQYIAHRGYRVANVPMVLGIPLPVELSQVDSHRIFGLLMDPRTLVEVRRTRMRHLGMEPTNEYGDPRRIQAELDECRRIFAEHPEWTLINVSGKAIEETATTILETYRARFERDANGNGRPYALAAMPPGHAAKPPPAANAAAPAHKAPPIAKAAPATHAAAPKAAPARKITPAPKAPPSSKAPSSPKAAPSAKSASAQKAASARKAATARKAASAGKVRASRPTSRPARRRRS
jgi:regulator of PEP synthase PpsR (kinase-PPPase family)